MPVWEWMTDDKRPPRLGWAPGNYISKCHGAGCADKADKRFLGDKRAITCADCAYALPDPAPSVPQLSVEEAALVVCHAWRDHSVATDAAMVKALINPIAELGRAIARKSPTS